MGVLSTFSVVLAAAASVRAGYSATSKSNVVLYWGQNSAEFLDSTGNIIKDPLLVMRSIDVQDARAHLDALYEASPGYSGEIDQEN